jgi:hypothetical protein
MRLIRYIKELSMSKDTIIEYRKDGPKVFAATIILKTGQEFNVNAHLFEKDSDKFFLSANIPDEYIFKTGQLSILGFSFEDASGHTHTTMKVGKFALGLFAAIQEVLAKWFMSISPPPDVVQYSGIGKSKIKLYSTMLKKAKKLLPGYVAYEKDAGPGSGGAKQYYLFRK